MSNEAVQVEKNWRELLLNPSELFVQIKNFENIQYNLKCKLNAITPFQLRSNKRKYCISDHK